MNCGDCVHLLVVEELVICDLHCREWNEDYPVNNCEYFKEKENG